MQSLTHQLPISLRKATKNERKEYEKAIKN
jgi:uncharacterized DUF497 family protein